MTSHRPRPLLQGSDPAGAGLPTVRACTGRQRTALPALHAAPTAPTPARDDALFVSCLRGAGWLGAVLFYDTGSRFWRLYEPTPAHNGLLPSAGNPDLRDPAALEHALRWATDRLNAEDTALRRVQTAHGRPRCCLRQIAGWLPIEYLARRGWAALPPGWHPGDSTPGESAENAPAPVGAAPAAGGGGR